MSREGHALLPDALHMALRQLQSNFRTPPLELLLLHHHLRRTTRFVTPVLPRKWRNSGATWVMAMQTRQDFSPIRPRQSCLGRDGIYGLTRAVNQISLQGPYIN